MRGSAKPDQGKDATAAAFGSFMVVAGVWLLSAAFVFGPLAWVVTALAVDADRPDASGWALLAEPVFTWVMGSALVIWTAIGALLLTGWADRRVWRPRLGCRDPSPGEAVRLTPLWDDVFNRAGIDRNAYLLQVSDRPVQNAFAVGDGVITLDQGILGMSDPELKAIIAHELGHHVRRHTAANGLALWFGLPARTLLILLMAISFGMIRTAGSIRGCGCSLIWISLMVVVLIPTAALYLLLGGADLLLRLLDRKSEMEADAYSASIGYRDELVAALAVLKEIYGDPEPGSRFSVARLASTHPSFSDRITAASRIPATATGSREAAG